MCFHHANLATFDGAAMPFAEPGVAPHYAPDRRVRIDHLDIHLSVSPVAKRIEGKATFQVTAMPTYLGQVELDFVDGTPSRITVNGADAAWTLADDVLRIPAVAPTEVTVHWEIEAPRAGFYFTGPTDEQPERQHMAWTQCQDEDAHFFMPCHDHPRDKHSWHITIEAPTEYSLLSNGMLVEQGNRDGKAYAVYSQDQPMPAYLFTVVVAKLSAFEASCGDTPLRYLVPEGEEEAAIRAMGKTPLMMEMLAKRTGVPYPWPRYDQVVVHDFIFGGMENVACTTMTELLLVDEKACVHYDPDSLVAHELAHQWFGDLVTCQDWSQAWLNESWATYVEQLWWEADRSVGDATWYRWSTAHEYFAEDGGRYRRPIVAYGFREPIDVFDRHLYQKGSCVLHTLRCELGDDAFFAGVNLYLTRHRDGSVHTRHFQRAIEDASGINLDGFFHQWVHGAGHPVSKVTLGKQDGLLEVSVSQSQDHDQTEPAFRFKLRLEVLTDQSDEPLIVDLPVSRRDQTFVVPLPGNIAQVRVNPGFRVLAQITVAGPTAWLVQSAADSCPAVAIPALKALHAEGSKTGLGAIQAQLSQHPQWGVRDAAAMLLASGGPTARDQLIEALKQDGDPRAKRAICTALGSFTKDQAVADALIVTADTADTWHLQAEALVALGRTRDPRGVATIRDHLDVDSWGHLVRSQSLIALAHTRDPAVFELIEVRARGGHDRVRAGAATALGILGDHVPELRQQCAEVLCAVLEGDGFRCRLSAAAALAVLKVPASISALTRTHQAAADGRVRRMAYEALVRVRQGRTTEAGLNSLRDRVSTLASENAKLRERLDKLERTQ
jgi:aminopeptidase N